MIDRPRNPRLLSEAEFVQMMREFDQASEWMREQLHAPEPLLMEKHVISLERQNLAEFESLERLASANGIEAFECAA